MKNTKIALLLISMFLHASLGHAMEVKVTEEKVKKAANQSQKKAKTSKLPRSMSSDASTSPESSIKSSSRSSSGEQLSPDSGKRRLTRKLSVGLRESATDLYDSAKRIATPFMPSVREESATQPLHTSPIKQKLIIPSRNPIDESLKFAVCQGDFECVQGLLTKDFIDPNGVDFSTGNTGLHYAFERKYPEIIDLLLQTPKVQSARTKNSAGKIPAGCAAGSMPEDILLRHKGFHRASVDACIEKHVVAALINKNPQDVTFSDVQKTTSWLIVEQLDALDIKQLAADIDISYTKDYEQQKLTQDRELPEKEPYITQDFIQEAAQAWFNEQLKKQ